MKIVNIIGGIGNQMFQYAFALALKQKYPDEDVKLDTSHFKGYSLHNGFEIERNFGLLLEIASCKDLRKLTFYSPNYKISRVIRKILGYRKTEYKEPKLFTFWQEALDRKGHCYYEGSWQNEKYFKEIESLIREAFTFKQPLEEKNKALLNQINSTESVSIHVRRGDYLKDPTYEGICDLPYYKNSIAYIKEHVENPHFYFFSNDAKWCEENIAPLCENYTVIDWNGGEKSWADMLLMSKCIYNIIAHSSFSWWAAWLNNHKDKIVVSPRGWFNRADVTDSPQLEDWVLIDNI